MTGSCWTAVPRTQARRAHHRSCPFGLTLRPVLETSLAARNTLKYGLHTTQRESLTMRMSSAAGKRQAPWPAAKSKGDPTEVRYKIVASEKAEGATYTPRVLADF